MNRPDEPARMVQDFDNGTLSRITPRRRIGPWSRSSVWLVLVGVVLFASLSALIVAENAPQPECQMEDC